MQGEVERSCTPAKNGFVQEFCASLKYRASAMASDINHLEKLHKFSQMPIAAFSC